VGQETGSPLVDQEAERKKGLRIRYTLPTSLYILYFPELPKIVPLTQHEAFNTLACGEISYSSHNVLPLYSKDSWTPQSAKYIQSISNGLSDIPNSKFKVSMSRLCPFPKIPPRHLYYFASVG
jgi:hypothetical protein